MNARSKGVVVLAALALALPALSADPPSLVSYQGVLRDAADAPLDGTFDIVFRFFGAELGGDEILVDTHSAGNANPVTVSGGLFSAWLGGGTLTDGSGPGTYSSLARVFADHSAVYLEVAVGGETLAPRTRIVAAAYALNASQLGGRAAGEFVDTTATSQTKLGPLRLDASAAPSSIAVDGRGQSMGGYFADSNSSGYAYVGYGDFGISASGNSAGAYFADHDHSGYAYIGFGDIGVDARGSTAGGQFDDIDGSGWARLGVGDSGIEAYGNSRGGYFEDLSDMSRAVVASAGYGIDARGPTAGGYFTDDHDSGTAYVGYGNRGVYAYGSEYGAYFQDLDSSGYAFAGYGDVGVEAHGQEMGARFFDIDNSAYSYHARNGYGIQSWGTAMGGMFDDSNGTGLAYVANGDIGISAYGATWGGYFEDTDGSGMARLGDGDIGVNGFGDAAGGHFLDTDHFGEAWVGYGNRGIWARGTFAGGTFSHPNGTTFWADVSTPVDKIKGTGVVGFVQNHPYDPGRVIVYSAPEGDEAAVYTRGRAQLAGGVARVPLGETFRYVANPDIGLTAHLTPHGAGALLYVEALGTEELVVRAADASAPDVAFDYIVYGLRLGFEELGTVRVKDREAFLPAAEAVAATRDGDPSLDAFTALERHRAMRAEIGEPPLLAMPGRDALVARLEEQRADAIARLEIEGGAEAGARPERATPPADPGGSPPAPAVTASLDAATVALADPLDVETAAADPLSAFPVSEPVERGDLLALDPDRPGALRRAATPADRGVVGIATEPSSVVDGALAAPVCGAGFTLVRADAAYGPIAAGDLLIASPAPGHAMRTDVPVAGAVVGKALEPLVAGAGLIKVLVMPR